MMNISVLDLQLTALNPYSRVELVLQRKQPLEQRPELIQRVQTGSLHATLRLERRPLLVLLLNLNDIQAVSVHVKTLVLLVSLFQPQLILVLEADDIGTTKNLLHCYFKQYPV